MPLDHCKECGSSSLDIDTAKGQVVCTVCGEVNESTIVVNDPTYEDNGHGGASVIGTFVSGTSSGAGGLGEGFRGYRHGISRSSKEVTFEKIRREINDRGHQLRMEQHNIDKAFNIYKLAFENRLTKGRRNDVVIAAALYITCRCDGGNAQYLMIDFSEQFGVDIYELGRTFIHFTKALHFTLNSIDPCLYIMRFANRLEFAKQTSEVCNTAMRLVQRMKKDHLHVGRRPSGLCGAALLFAARHHGFNRKPADIVRVVKVHESTLRKRMVEFGDTPSSLLSYEDFMSVDLEEEQDPPSYKEARRKEREIRDKAKKAQTPNLDDNSMAEIGNLQRQLEELLDNKKGKKRRRLHSEMSVCESIATDDDDGEILKAIEDSTMTSLVACINPVKDIVRTNIESASFDSGPTLEMLGLGPKNIKAVECTAEEVLDNNGELDLEGLDDEEIDSYILSNTESKEKESLWLEENADYLKLQAEKEAQEAQDRLEGKPEKKKRKNQRKKNLTPAATAGEAIEKMLKEKKLSQKINYDVLKQLREGSLLGSETNANSIVNKTLTPSSPRILNKTMPPPPIPKTSLLPRRMQFKLAPTLPSTSVKKEDKIKPPASPKKRTEGREEQSEGAEINEEDDEDYYDEDEEEDEEDDDERPISISQMLSQQQELYDRDYI